MTPTSLVSVWRLAKRLYEPAEPLRLRSGFGNAKTKAAPAEGAEQAAVVKYIEWQYPQVRKLTASVPNGANKSRAARANFKREGLTPGYPDLLIDYPRGPYHGLRIEMKRRAKSLSAVHDAQWLWRDNLRRQGFRVVICYGKDEAIAEIDQYIALGEFSITAYLRMWYTGDEVDKFLWEVEEAQCQE